MFLWPAMLFLATALEAPEPVDCSAEPRFGLFPHDLVLTCESFRKCSGELTIEVVNCRPAPLEVRRLEVELVRPEHREPSKAPFRMRTQWNSDFPPREFWVPPGHRRLFRQQVDRYGDVEVRARGLLGAVAVQLPPSTARMVNPLRDGAQRACAECNGEWGPHGLFQREGCNCRARDAGRVCRDGADCEGSCLFERLEMLPEPPPPPPGQLPPYPRRLGRPVGRCSEFITVWGCSDVIPVGASKGEPWEAIFGAPNQCAD